MAGEVSVTIVGNLADDPELRYTQGGVAVAVSYTHLTLPTNREV